MDAPDSFNTIGDAFVWYASEGGQREKTSFYAKVPRASGSKRISRFAVSEMLRKERAPKGVSGGNYADRKEEAEINKAEAEAEIKQRQNERERREMDAEWVRREIAEEETCVWVSRLRDATAYHLGKNLLAVIHGCGGNPSRLSEVQAIVDEALAAAANEISQSGEITVEIE